MLRLLHRMRYNFLRFLRGVFVVERLPKVLFSRGGLFLCGAVGSLGWAPFFWVPSFAIAINVLFVRLWRAERPQKGFKDGFWWGWGLWMGSLFWVSEALFVDIEKFWWVLPFSSLGVPAFLALYTGFLGLCVVWTKERIPGVFPYLILFTISWSAIEWLRSVFPIGFPWNLTAYIWGGVLPIAQLASLIGSYGLGFVTILSLSLPGMAILCGGIRPLLKVAGCLAFGFVLSFTYGTHRLSHVGPGYQKGISLRLVQPCVPQTIKEDRKRSMEQIAILEKLSRQPGHPTHIIWPESAIPWAMTPQRMRSRIISYAPPEGVSLFSGAVTWYSSWDNTHVSHNSLVRRVGEGAFENIYDKHRLLPFGEYFPGRTFFERFVPIAWLQAMTPGMIDFVPGQSRLTVNLAGTPPFSPLICYEIVFPGGVIHRASAPQWILNITNDGWFGKTTGPYQHLTTAVFRAIEEGVPVVRVANTGISAVIDAYGRILNSIPLGECGVLDSLLPNRILEVDAPIYSRIGEWLFVMFLGGGVVLLFLIQVKRRRKH